MSMAAFLRMYECIQECCDIATKGITNAYAKKIVGTGVFYRQ